MTRYFVHDFSICLLSTGLGQIDVMKCNVTKLNNNLITDTRNCNGPKIMRLALPGSTALEKDH